MGYKHALEVHKLSRKSHEELHLHKDKPVELSSVLSLLLLFCVLIMCSLLVVIGEIMFKRHRSTKIINIKMIDKTHAGNKALIQIVRRSLRPLTIINPTPSPE